MNSPGEDESGGREGATGVVLPGRFIPHKRSLKYPHECGLTHIYIWAQNIHMQLQGEVAPPGEGKMGWGLRVPQTIDSESSEFGAVTAQETHLGETREWHEASRHRASWPWGSREAQAAGLPPWPDTVPHPPSLLSYRAGGPIRLRQSQHSLHRYYSLSGGEKVIRYKY